MTKNRNIAVLSLLYLGLTGYIFSQSKEDWGFLIMAILPLILSCFLTAEVIVWGSVIGIMIVFDNNLHIDKKYLFPIAAGFIVAILLLRIIKAIYWILSVLLCLLYAALYFYQAAEVLGTAYDLFLKVMSCFAVFSVTILFHRYAEHRRTDNLPFAASFYAYEEEEDDEW